MTDITIADDHIVYNTRLFSLEKANRPDGKDYSILKDMSADHPDFALYLPTSAIINAGNGDSSGLDQAIAIWDLRRSEGLAGSFPCVEVNLEE